MSKSLTAVTSMFFIKGHNRTGLVYFPQERVLIVKTTKYYTISQIILTF